MSYKGNLYIISAPSGTGKTSLVNGLVQSDPNLVVSVSHTTRPPRPLEVDGVNYHFVNVPTFNTMVLKRQFLEYATIYGHHYGTSRTWVEDRLNDGLDVILEIDWQGAVQIMQMFDCVSVFIMPPSKEVLLDRLRKRAQDNEEVINTRMKEAAIEASHYGEYEYLVLNDDFDNALKDLQSIVKAKRLAVSNQRIIHQDLIKKIVGFEVN